MGSLPVARTGRTNRRKYRHARTGTMGSKALSHRYGDEGEKGPGHRRLIRRAEHRQWRRERDLT
ncbi:hypothetical protein ACIBUR_39300 [Streptomyces anulatus]|uniref:hypothetical protein n=1 Tax=Streptomyces microflavus TaxID=1919 RepID=UPI00379204B6